MDTFVVLTLPMAMCRASKSQFWANAREDVKTIAKTKRQAEKATIHTRDAESPVGPASAGRVIKPPPCTRGSRSSRVRAHSGSAFAAGADAGRIRDAATRNLALFQQSQKHWFEVQRCDSCHHQYQPALAYRAAREHGIAFDESIARADAAKAFTYADLDRAVQYSWIIEPAVDDAYRLIAADAAGVRPNLTTSVMARLLMARQNRGGDWPSHRQRPPSSYSNVTFTALGVRAIALYAHPSQKAELAKHVTLARQWFLSHQAVDTEERTYKLLGLKWAGGDRSSIAAATRPAEDAGLRRRLAFA